MARVIVTGPDMAPLLFTRAIVEGQPIRVFNAGDMRRDFTYVEDVADAVARVLDGPPAAGMASHRVYNVGSGAPVDLLRLLDALEKEIGRAARLVPAPMQPGDVKATFADVSDLVRDFGFRPRTALEEGIRRLVPWYLSAR